MAAETTAAVVAAHPTSWLRRGRAKASRLSRLLGSIVHLKKPNICVGSKIYFYLTSVWSYGAKWILCSSLLGFQNGRHKIPI